MGKFSAATLALVLFCIPAFAQDAPQFEAYGGFSLTRIGPESLGVNPEEFGIPNEYVELAASALGFDGLVLPGFLASGEYSVRPRVNIVGEFGYGAWESYYSLSAFGASISASGDIDVFTAMFGPRLSYRTERFRFFGHYLLGFARSSVNGSYEYEYDEYSDSDSIEMSDTAFGQAVGGGIDISVSNLLSIRLGQMDLVSTSFDLGGYSDWQHFFRYSGGIVFKFGSK